MVFFLMLWASPLMLPAFSYANGFCPCANLAYPYANQLFLMLPPLPKNLAFPYYAPLLHPAPQLHPLPFPELAFPYLNLEGKPTGSFSHRP